MLPITLTPHSTWLRETEITGIWHKHYSKPGKKGCSLRKQENNTVFSCWLCSPKQLLSLLMHRSDPVEWCVYVSLATKSCSAPFWHFHLAPFCFCTDFCFRCAKMQELSTTLYCVQSSTIIPGYKMNKCPVLYQFSNTVVVIQLGFWNQWDVIFVLCLMINQDYGFFVCLIVTLLKYAYVKQ